MTSFVERRRQIVRLLRSNDRTIESLRVLIKEAASREPRYLAKIEASWALREVVRTIDDQDYCLEASRLLVQEYGADADFRFAGDTLSPVQAAIYSKQYELASYLKERGARIDKPMFVQFEGRPRRLKRHGRYEKRRSEFERFVASKKNK